MRCLATILFTRLLNIRTVFPCLCFLPNLVDLLPDFGRVFRQIADKRRSLRIGDVHGSGYKRKQSDDSGKRREATRHSKLLQEINQGRQDEGKENGYHHHHQDQFSLIHEKQDDAECDYRLRPITFATVFQGNSAANGLLRRRALDGFGGHPSIVAKVEIFGDAIIAGVPGENTGSEPNRLPRRILGLDVGSKTIGMAVSDPLGITAQGLTTLRRQNKRLDYAALETVIGEYDVAEIVVGYPLRMSGATGIQSDKMMVFAEELRKKFKLPVHLWDERLTSAEANRVLRDSEMSIKRRGEVVDRLAAVLILQSWMDNRSREAGDELKLNE